MKKQVALWALSGVLAVVGCLGLLIRTTYAGGMGYGIDYDLSLIIGDPIMANSGQYYFDMPVLNLRGPKPMGVAFHHRTGGPRSRGFPWRGNIQHNLDPTLFWSSNSVSGVSAVNAFLRNYQVLAFEQNAGPWALDPEMPTRYSLQETGSDQSNGWYYVSDPVQEQVYMFEKVPEQSYSTWADTRLVYWMDRNHNTHSYSYPNGGSLMITNISDGLGRELDFEYESMQDMTGIVDRAGRRIDIIHDYAAADADGGHIVRHIVDPSGGTTTFHYVYVSGTTAIAAEEYPVGNKPYTQAYARVGLNLQTNVRVTAQTDAYGNTTLIGYDSQTNRVTETRADTTTVEYLHFGSHEPPQSLVDASGSSVDSSRAATRRQVASITDRLGNTTTIVYHEPSGKIVSYQDARGGLNSNTYATVSQVFTNPANAELVTNMFHDLVRRDYPDGTHETFGYDGCGNPTVRVDRAGHAWSYTYNDRGQVLTATGPDGGVATYAYNTLDATLDSRTDSDTGVTTYEYDTFKRVHRINRPDGESVGFGYDLNDRLTSYTNGSGSVTAYVYDANGNRLSTTDAGGYVRSREYDLMDRVTNTTDSIGVLTAYAFDNLERPASVTDADSNAAVPSYDSRGWVTNVTRAGGTWATAYDDEGVPTSRTTPLGYSTGYQPDSLGIVTGVVDALNQDYAYERDSMTRVTRSTDPLGNTRTYTYDGMGRLLSVTAPVIGTATYTRTGLGAPATYTDFENETWGYGYTPMGLLSSITNPLGQVTAYSYDTAGYLDRTDFADGTHTEFSYDADGRVRTAMDRGGYARQYGYDHAGRLLSVTNPAGGVASATYHLDGTVATWTDSDIGIYSNRYDALRRPARTTLPDGATVQYEYDAFNRITNVTDAARGTRSYEYDADGRLTQSTDPEGNYWDYAYDALGRLTNFADRFGNAYAYEYDAGGRLVAVTDPNGVEMTYSYDGADRRTETTLDGDTWQYGYDDESRLTSLTTPLGRTTTFARNGVGAVTSITDPVGYTTTFEYDTMQRVTEIVDPVGRTNQFSYEGRGLMSGASNALFGAAYAYNNLGLLETLTDPNGHDWAFGYTDMGRLQYTADPLSRTNAYTYDSRGRLSRVDFADGQDVTIGYDAVGNPTNHTYADGTQIRYEYDALNRLVHTTGTTDAVTFTYDVWGRITGTDNPGTAFNITYSDAGRIAAAHYNNGAFAATYTYDAAGRVGQVQDSLTGTVIKFSYDKDGRLIGIERPNGVDTRYSYDGADRVVRIQHGNKINLIFQLDSAGRVEWYVDNAPTTASSYITSDSRTDTFNAADEITTPGHSHDDRGRLTQKPGAWSSTWTDSGDLASVSVGPLFTSTQTYNGLGDLVTRTQGGTTKHYYLNHGFPNAPIVAEKNDTTGQFDWWFICDPGGAPLYAIDAADGNKVYHYHYGREGSTRALTDETGMVTDSYAYSPYGRMLAHDGSSTQPLGYRGQSGRCLNLVDDIYWVGGRNYYDSDTGRTLNRWYVPGSVNGGDGVQSGYKFTDWRRSADQQGDVSIYTYGTQDLIVDVSGYFPGTAEPRRSTGESLSVSLSPTPSEVGSVAAADLQGFVSIHPHASPRPNAGNLNYFPGTAGSHRPAGTSLTVSTSPGRDILTRQSRAGSVSIYTFAQQDLLVDVTGYLPGSKDPLRDYSTASADVKRSTTQAGGGWGGFYNSGTASADSLGDVSVYTYAPQHLIVDVSGYCSRDLNISSLNRPSLASNTSGGSGGVFNSSGGFYNSGSGCVFLTDVTAPGQLPVAGSYARGKTAVASGLGSVAKSNCQTPKNSAGTRYSPWYDAFFGISFHDPGLTPHVWTPNQHSNTGTGSQRFTSPSADFDADGDVDGDDFLTWQAGFGSQVPPGTSGDADGDGTVDGDDFLVWQTQFGNAP